MNQQTNNSEIITNVDYSPVNANFEIFSNYITELDDTFTNGESEKNRNSEFSSMGKHLNDDKYSKIVLTAFISIFVTIVLFDCF